MHPPPLLCLTVLAGLVAGCGGSNAAGPEGPLGGHWSGTASSVTLDMTLDDRQGTISGSCQFAAPGAGILCSVSGSRTDTTASLKLSAQGYQPATYIGVLTTDSTFGGTLNGSGFGSYTFFITVKKQ